MQQAGASNRPFISLNHVAMLYALHIMPCCAALHCTAPCTVAHKVNMTATSIAVKPSWKAWSSTIMRTAPSVIWGGVRGHRA